MDNPGKHKFDPYLPVRPQIAILSPGLIDKETLLRTGPSELLQVLAMIGSG